MIRILHVVTHMNRGGLETMLMNYYRHIDRKNIQFDFLTHREERAAYDDEIEALGGKIYRFPVLNPFSQSYRGKLRNFFRQHPEYKIVHVHQDCLSSVILKEASVAGVPVRIAHSHSTRQDRDLKYPIKLFYKRFIPRYATDLMACGKDAGNWMFSGAEFQILNNAIDAKAHTFDAEKRAAVRAQWTVESKTLLVGHVGRFSPAKNHDFLLDIFQEIDRRTAAKLMLVGDGALRKEMEEKAKTMGLFDKLIFTGVRSDVPELMQAMDVFVFPSLYEGLPVTLVEAQASGLPCLISDKVPMECRKTDLIEQLPLAIGAKVWAQAAEQAAKTKRQNTYQAIAQAGFDIAKNATWLENFYQSKIEAL